jgi:hypothetical protein
MGLFDLFRRSEQPDDAIDRADALLDEFDRTTPAAEARKHAEWRRVTALTEAQNLFNACPSRWCGTSEEAMTAMVTRWMNLRDLVRAGCNPEMAVRP